MTNKIKQWHNERAVNKDNQGDTTTIQNKYLTVEYYDLCTLSCDQMTLIGQLSGSIMEVRQHGPNRKSRKKEIYGTQSSIRMIVQQA